MTTVLIIEALAILLLGLMVFGLLQSHAEILRRLHDVDGGSHGADTEHHQQSDISLTEKPPLTQEGVATPRPDATPAHDIVGTTAEGDARTVGVIGSNQTTLLAFLSTGCMSCKGFWDAFTDPELVLPGRDTRLVIVTKGLDNESPSAIRKLAPNHVTMIASSSAWEDYDVTLSPYFILVDGPSGSTLGEGAAATWGQIDNLLGQAMADLGLEVTHSTSTRRTAKAGQDRSDRADAELASAGIMPGDPSLYPGPSFHPGRDG